MEPYSTGTDFHGTKPVQLRHALIIQSISEGRSTPFQMAYKHPLDGQSDSAAGLQRLHSTGTGSDGKATQSPRREHLLRTPFSWFNHHRQQPAP